MADSPDRLQRLYDYLPEYVCGMVWTVDLIGLIMVTTTPTEARHAVALLATIIGPNKLPDLAVGFVLAVFGVLLPYALALALNPISAKVMNVAIRRWYWTNPRQYTTKEQFDEAMARLRRIGIEPPRQNWPAALMFYLEQIASPVHPGLDRQRQLVFVQGRLTLPIAILVSLLVYVTAGQSFLTLVASVSGGLTFWAAAIHFAASALMRADEMVLLAFLVSSTNYRSDAIQPKPIE